jgi:hypothetical protein
MMIAGASHHRPNMFDVHFQGCGKRAMLFGRRLRPTGRIRSPSALRCRRPFMQSVPAEGTMLVKKPRGRPRDSRVSPVVQMMRQTGNSNFMAATIARAIIDHHQPREEKEKRLRAKLAACEARGGDIWPIIDALGMLDTVDDPAVGLPREEKRVTHKKAARMAIEFLDDGVAKPVVTVETDAAGRRMVCSKLPHNARGRKPDPKKFLDSLRRGRA